LQLNEDGVLGLLTESDRMSIHTIEEKLNKIGCFSGSAFFLRLSTRSPKDSALSSLKTRQIIDDLLLQSKMSSDNPYSAETVAEDLKIFTIASTLSLKTQSTREGISLLLHSRRVVEDIMVTELNCADPVDANWSMQLVAREWWDDIYPPYEFRCFVSNNQMTAITQYYSLCYLPEIVLQKALVLDMILTKWALVHPLLKVHTYTIDFAFSIDLDHIMVVEINPFPPIAGTALFNYHNESDRHIIQHGKKKVDPQQREGESSGISLSSIEFRLLESPEALTLPGEGLDAIERSLANFIDSRRGRRGRGTERGRGEELSAINDEILKSVCLIM
jgi:hypothetical protein